MDDNQYSYMWVPVAGDANVLEWCSGTLPELNTDQIQIRIEASGVIQADLRMRNGQGHPGSPAIPYSPGHEIVGIIEAIGSSVTDLEVGQRVVAILLTGGYATHAIVDSWRCIPIADGVDPIKAVCVLINYWTAYHCLHRVAQVKQGDCVLIHGASGGVGTSLLELGKLAGLKMYGTASKQKHQQLEVFGATLINYHSTDFTDYIRTQTQDKLDAVLDSIGGSYWRKGYRLLKRSGHLIIYGAKFDKIVELAPYIIEMLIRYIIPDGKHINVVGLSPEKHTVSFREDVTHLQSLLKQGQLNPIVGAVIPMQEASSAHTKLENGDITGKIVLVN